MIKPESPLAACKASPESATRDEVYKSLKNPHYIVVILPLRKPPDGSMHGVRSQVYRQLPQNLRLILLPQLMCQESDNILKKAANH